MNITEIEAELRKIEALVARWSEQGYVPQIEKNIALQRVQKFYELFLELDTQPQLEARASAHTHTIITPDPAADKEPQAKTEQQKSDLRAEHIDVVEYVEVERRVQEPAPAPEPTPQAEPRFSIFGIEISKEQKERFTHDLFCNDPLVFHNEIVKLERLHSLDDVLIYIGEKYAWTPDNRSADEFVEIISRKF